MFAQPVSPILSREGPPAPRLVQVSQGALLPAGLHVTLLRRCPTSVEYAAASSAHSIEMPSVLDPFRFVLMAVAGWMNQRQLQIIDSLREETPYPLPWRRAASACSARSRMTVKKFWFFWPMKRPSATKALKEAIAPEFAVEV